MSSEAHPPLDPAPVISTEPGNAHADAMPPLMPEETSLSKEKKQGADSELLSALPVHTNNGTSPPASPIEQASTAACCPVSTCANPTTPSTTSWSKFIYVICGNFVVGIAFGFGMERSRVYVPSVIWDQLALRGDFTMMRVFLTAVVGGLFALPFIEYFFPTLFKRAPKAAVAFTLFDTSSTAPATTKKPSFLAQYSGTIVGSALVGFGMVFTGACPGTVFIQFATPTYFIHSLQVLLGIVIGSTLFGYVAPPTKTATTALTFDKDVIKTQYAIIAYPLALFMFIPLIIAFTLLLAEGSTEAIKWGLAISGAQVLSAIVLGHVIGVSRVFGYMGARIASVIDPWGWKTRAPVNAGPFMKHEGFVMVVGMIGGAVISQWAVGVFHNEATKTLFVPPFLFRHFARLVLGGVLLVFGSRIGEGCTSGHGLSGIAQLSVASFISVASMFGGGIILSLVTW